MEGREITPRDEPSEDRVGVHLRLPLTLVEGSVFSGCVNDSALDLALWQ